MKDEEKIESLRKGNDIEVMIEDGEVKLEKIKYEELMKVREEGILK